MTAITIQSNKIVLNEVKDKLSTTRIILWNKWFWSTPYKHVANEIQNYKR